MGAAPETMPSRSLCRHAIVAMAATEDLVSESARSDDPLADPPEANLGGPGRCRAFHIPPHRPQNPPPGAHTRAGSLKAIPRDALGPEPVARFAPHPS